MTTDLWPPLSVIRHAFETGAPPGDAAPDAAPVAMPHGNSAGAGTPVASDLLLP